MAGSPASNRTTRVTSLGVLLLALLVAGLLVPGGAARSASNAVTFTDPSGDSGGAADITAVEGIERRQRRDHTEGESPEQADR
jgi:hypothetical protein